MEEAALARGLQIVRFNEKADVYVVNTCTVTAHADQQCRKLSRQARARNPAAEVVLVGCFVQAQPELVARLEAPSFTLDNDAKPRLFDTLDSRARGSLPVVGATAAREAGANHADLTNLDTQLRQGVFRRRRAFVKVQDGCDEICTYCIIPSSRGKGRSLPLAEVVAEAERCIDAGYQELVIVGVHLSAWGEELLGRPTLASVLRRLCELPNLQRLRLSSLEPEGVTDELVEALAHPKVCKHFHVSVQSGSARILRAMRRNYLPRDVERAIERLSLAIDDFGLGSDFITGFPGETDADFAETLSLVERLPFSYLHAFPYSERPGTAAVSMPDQIPVAERSARTRALLELGRRKKDDFIRSRIGRTYRTWLYSGAGDGARARAQERTPGADSSVESDSTLRGLTGNYLTLRVAAAAELNNTFADVRLTEWRNGQLLGELVSAPRR